MLNYLQKHFELKQITKLYFNEITKFLFSLNFTSIQNKPKQYLNNVKIISKSIVIKFNLVSMS